MNNQKLWISTGKSREELKWKNQEVTWEKLVAKLQSPVVTEETYSKYSMMSKAQQMVIKDVGGFVGGVINGGRRVVNSCSARYVITLDIDVCTTEFADDVRMMYGNAMVIHTTHKHSPATPRYRLVMPLKRELLPDEYEAVARKVAGNIGIELFDVTTFQPERLMFWPSHSVDGEYQCLVYDGPWLDPDEVLDEYNDWRDTSEWPISEKAAKGIRSGISKQENPLEKGGQIGVWCRAYGIAEAIEKYLPEVYIATDHDDRWTYAHGSTNAGMIVYDNLFSYSHHSTDPTMGRLCNAFDLVRIHLYGHADDNMADSVPANKKPSYVKMIELMTKDPKVKKLGLTEQLMQLQGEFAPEEGADLDWTEKLEVDKKGAVLCTVDNLVTILNGDQALKNNLSYDDFEKKPMLQRDLPWRKVEPMTKWLTDTDDADYRNYFEKVYKLVSPSKILDAMNIVIRQHKFHPVKDYLKSQVWDGEKRLEEIFIKYLGAEDSVYTREVTRKTLVAAVARIFEPGCKFDYVLTLVGGQGLGKSRFIKALAGKWYSDTFGNVMTNQAMENIQGVWIMEIGELAGLKRAEVETIKLFISKQSDRFRVAYGKRVDEFPRQTIFIGTTNDDTPLHDKSGGRRFWMMPVTRRNRQDMSSAEIGQIWAEAAYYYAQGEELFLTDEVESIATEIQAQHSEQDDRTEEIAKYLDVKLPAAWAEMSTYDRINYLGGDEGEFGPGIFSREKVSIPEIWLECLRMLKKDMSPYNVKFVRHIMNKMPGWKPKLIRQANFGTQRGWERQSAAIAAENEFSDDLRG